MKIILGLLVFVVAVVCAERIVVDVSEFKIRPPLRSLNKRDEEIPAAQVPPAESKRGPATPPAPVGSTSDENSALNNACIRGDMSACEAYQAAVLLQSNMGKDKKRSVENNLKMEEAKRRVAELKKEIKDTKREFKAEKLGDIRKQEIANARNRMRGQV